MDLTNANLKALFVGYKTNFQTGFDSLGPNASIYEQISTVVNSTTATETYPWMKTLPKLREWLGDRVVHGLEASSFSIRNRKFELTEGIGRDTIEDDTYGLYSPMFEEFGRSSREHPNELQVEVMQANPVCFDGQPLFDADHPVLDANGAEVSMSNDMGGSGPAWYVMDLSRAIRPFVFQRRRPYSFRAMTDLRSDKVFMTDDFTFGVDARVNAGPGLWMLIVRSKQPLDATSYAAARDRLKGFTGDRARPLGLMHTHTMVPSGMEQAARKVLVSSLGAGGETNEWAGSSQLLENPWMASV